MFAYGLVFASLVFATLRYFGLADRQPAVRPRRRSGLEPAASPRSATPWPRPAPAIPWKSPAASIRSSSGSQRGHPAGPHARCAGLARRLHRKRTGRRHSGGGVQGARVFGFRIRADEKAPLAWPCRSRIPTSNCKTPKSWARPPVWRSAESPRPCCAPTPSRIARRRRPDLRRFRAMAFVQRHLRNGRGRMLQRRPGPGVLIEAPAHPC